MKEQWSREQAQTWYEQKGWLCGFNYLPSTAVNWTDIWQEETFDAVTIERELGWAAAAGYNTLRINLPFIVWEHDRDGLIARIDHFLAIAAGHGFSTMLTLMDDCGFSGDEPYLGPQKSPVPGKHNSQAAASLDVIKSAIAIFGRRLNSISAILLVSFVKTSAYCCGIYITNTVTAAFSRQVRRRFNMMQSWKVAPTS